jgi:glycosyltransferase involved in cell wall biosynthesis
MRVLTVVPVMGAGGAEAVVGTLATDLLARGHDHTVASAGGFRMDLLAAAGVGRLHVPLDGRGPRDLARAAAALRRHCRQAAPDLVHAHNVKAAAVTRLGVGRGVPLLATLHGVPPRQYAAAARLLARCADRVVAVSPYVATELGRHGFPAGRVEVVPNAIDPLPVHDRTEARRRLGLPDEQVVGVCLARMTVQKRHDLLLAAWQRLPADAVLLLAGDGPTRPAVEDAVRRLGLTDRVRVLGERTDVDRLLAAADLAVLATDWEGLPISVLEAMAAGVPVVVSDVGDVAATVGEAARTVEPGSVPALAGALADLVGDPGGRARLGARGRALVTGRYGADRMLERYRGLYAALAGRAGTRPSAVTSRRSR